ATVQKPEPQRPQAAVQGITPAQPAPTPVPREEAPAATGPSIFEKIFGWLTRKPQAQPEPAKTRPRDTQSRRQHDRERHRGRNEEKREGRGGDRGERGGDQRRDGRQEHRRDARPESAEGRRDQQRREQGE